MLVLLAKASCSLRKARYDTWLMSTFADGVFLSSSTGECLKHPVTSSCENTVQDDVETLELIWARAIGICKSSSLKNLLQKRGKLVSVHLIQGN